MASPRRIGIESSETRGRLLDTAEQLMKEEGYPAVTTRRLAERAGVSNQLVHYYFRTMDDLFLSLMRRRAELNHRRLLDALASEQPLRALWEFNSDPEAVRTAVEFMALTNHRKLIREECARYAQQLREIETEALSRVLSDCGIGPDVLPPVCLSVLMASLPRTMVMEAGLGVLSGHAQTRELVDRYLRPLEERRKTLAQSRVRTAGKPTRKPAGKVAGKVATKRQRAQT
jgi:AcrR family transcriptional regulator